MMSKKLGLKVLVVLFSSTLVIALLLYKGGYGVATVDEIFSSPNGGVLPKKVAIDTTRKKERMLLPSSKSMVISKPVIIQDSGKAISDSLTLREEGILLFSSPKSAPVFPPNLDTTRNKRKPNKKKK